LTELEESLKEKEKENMKAESNLKAVKDNKKQEEKKMTQIQKGMNTVRSVSINVIILLKVCRLSINSFKILQKIH